MNCQHVGSVSLTMGAFSFSNVNAGVFNVRFQHNESVCTSRVYKQHKRTTYTGTMD